MDSNPMEQNMVGWQVVKIDIARRIFVPRVPRSRLAQPKGGKVTDGPDVRPPAGETRRRKCSAVESLMW